MEYYKEQYEKLLRDIDIAIAGQKEGEMKTVLQNLKERNTESEDEMIRKEMIKGFEALKEKHSESFATIPINKCIAWLKRHGETTNKVSIWKHWTNGIGGNGDGRQVFLIKRNGTYDVTSCLSNECDYIELSELDKLSSPNWKPSREQLMALIHAIGKAKEEAFSVDGDRLQSLYNDLTRNDTRNISKDLN